MKCAIQNTSGQWWTGECWGVEQAREEYDGEDLPIWLNDDEEDWLHLESGPIPIDTLYYRGDAYDAVAEAAVKEVK